MKKIPLYLEYIYIWLTLVTLMKWGIKLAALAILFGIVFIYIKKEHSLTIGAEQLQAAKQKSETSF